MYNFLVILSSFIIPYFILRKEFKKTDKKDFIRENKYNLIIYFAFAIGFIIRLVGIADFPNGLNVDEASSGYEAYCILNYGIDRNGNFMPVFLEAWGSGQNAFYTYLLIPFIKILGLNLLSVRLPMAIIGCISLIVFYKILKEISNKKITIIGLIFFVICPWHIMKSRWGLESNIFPDLILYAIYFIIKYLKNKKTRNIYFSAILLGLSSYAYGTSYFFLPIFVLLLDIFLLIKKEIKIKHVIGMLATIAIISLPIILFVIINTFNLEPINFIFTIPVLKENRYESITSLFNGNIIQNSLENFKNSINILINQNDELSWNAISPYGIIYIISIPFTLIGIFVNFKEKENGKWIWNLWFISAFLLLFIIEPNINRINIIHIPLIYFTIIGIVKAIEKIKLLQSFLLIAYISLFVSFQITYYTNDWSEYYTFVNGVENVIEYIDTLDVDKIYFEYAFKEPYIYVCFYNQISPYELKDTIKYKDEEGIFDNVESFGKYYFYIPDEIDLEENAAYVLKKESVSEINLDLFDVIYIDDFVVLLKSEN